MSYVKAKAIKVVLTKKSQHFPIVLWDKAGEKLFRDVLDGNGPIVVHDIDTKRYLHLKYLPLSLLYLSQALFSRKNNGSIFVRRHMTTLQGVVRVLGQCLNISMALSYRPKIILTYSDDSRTTQLMDAILHRHVTVITVQNGRRWHDKSLLNDPINASSYIEPGFHSCFAALSQQEADSHLEAQWLIDEMYIIGSINAAVTLRNTSITRYLFDICIIENSEVGLSRKSNREMVTLINSYVKKNKHLRVCVALKRNYLHLGYNEYYKSVRQLYDDKIELVPRNINGSSLATTLSSHVTIGVLSTLLIETFGMGGKIYPLNFEHDAYDSAYSCLNLNMRPTSVEFDTFLDELLALMPSVYLLANAEAMKYIGAISSSLCPETRLRQLVKCKLEAVEQQTQS